MPSWIDVTSASALLSYDFYVGAATMLGALGLYTLWQLLQHPSIESIEEMASKPLPHKGDDNKITVFGFDVDRTYFMWNEGVTDASPFVSRVEAYLRLVGKSYVKDVVHGLADDNPRHKAPYANILGQMVDDSSRIIDAVATTFNVKIDAHLTTDQLRTGYLLRQLLLNEFYWVMVHNKWETVAGRKLLKETLVDGKVPWLVKIFMYPWVLRYIRSQMYGCGFGRMSNEVLAKKGIQAVECFNSLIGPKNQFLFGYDHPSSYDADVYSFTIALFYDPLYSQQPWVDHVKKTYPNVVGHANRMRALLYPELSSSKSQPSASKPMVGN